MTSQIQGQTSFNLTTLNYLLERYYRANRGAYFDWSVASKSGDPNEFIFADEG